MENDINHRIAKDVAGLQAGITTALKKLENLDEDHPHYETYLAQVAQAGSALLAYEATIPAKRDEPHRQTSAVILTWAARAHMIGGVLLGLTPLTGWISWAWTFPAFVQLIVGLVHTAMEAKPHEHWQLRVSAGLLCVTTVLVPLLAADVVPKWCWLPAIGACVLSFVLAGDADQLAKGKTAT